MRYFFDNEGIFLRAIARNTGRRGCGGVFFYGLSPAIRDGGGVAVFFTGCRPQYGTRLVRWWWVGLLLFRVCWLGGEEVVELVQCQDVDVGERYLLDVIEMGVFGDDIVSSGSDGAVHKFIIILVDVGEQSESVIGFDIAREGMARDCFDDVVRHLWRCVQREDFLIFVKDFVAHAEAVFASKEIGPDYVVCTL